MEAKVAAKEHEGQQSCSPPAEASRSVSFSSSNLPPMTPGHRRAQSEVVGVGQRRANGFTTLKSQMQNAWRWGNTYRVEKHRLSFNPEVLAVQKRQWYQFQSKSRDQIKYKEPSSIFEHFIIAGLHPNANLDAAGEALIKRKRWEKEIAESGMPEYRIKHQRGPQIPIFEPQLLFKYPPAKKLAVRSKDLATFCFPEGVKARLLERTPSFSDLNELLYGQEHLGRDDLSFVFSLKVADNTTLYGVCLHVAEVVQRPPSILGNGSPPPQLTGTFNRLLVSAPRCYCLLTRVPFFELHYEMLNSIIAQERLNRITEFVNEVSLSVTDFSPSCLKSDGTMNDNVDSADEEYGTMASECSVDSILTAAASGMVTDDEIPSALLKVSSPLSPESITASEASDFGQIRDIDKCSRKILQDLDDNISEASECRSEAFEKLYDSGQASPEIGTFVCSRGWPLERIGSSQSLFSPARSIASDDDHDDDELSLSQEFGNDFVMAWARENKNDILLIVCGYQALHLPPRGSEVLFQPLEHLQGIEYMRPPVSALGIDEKYLKSSEAAEVDAKLAAAEEAFALSIWTTATICRVLSLDSVLALIAGVLLEKQVVLVCPNLGILSATVLSLISLIQPFQWQSLLLPILPANMLDFLDAPVPFIVGIHDKPTKMKLKTSSLVLVNLLKNQVKMCHLPTLPRHKELVAQLAPFHATLALEGATAKKHPVYRCSEVQAEAANQFLMVMRQYLEWIAASIQPHAITSVQSDNDRVSILLKDSYIDSFPNKDQPFVKGRGHFDKTRAAAETYGIYKTRINQDNYMNMQLVETQLFTVLSDALMASVERL